MHLKYTIQRLLVYSQRCISITRINFRTFSLPKKEILYPLAYQAQTPVSFIRLSPRHTNLFSVFMHLPVVDTSYKWNHALCGLF